MAAFIQLNAAQLCDVAVFDVQQAARDAAAQHALGGAGHGCSRLAGPDHVDVAITREVFARQPRGHAFGGVCSPQRGPENGKRLAAESGLALHLNNGSRSAASTATAGSSLSMGMQ